MIDQAIAIVNFVFNYWEIVLRKLEELLNSFDQQGASDLKKPTLLIIDDDKSIQRGFQSYFSHKYHVIGADSGTRGIAMLSLHPVQCIILDIKMEKMNGFDAYPQLKAKAPDVPIIFYSGFQDEHDVKSILNQYRPDGYFSKGDEIKDIETAIAQSIRKSLKAIKQQKKANNLKAELNQKEKTLGLLHKRLSTYYRLDTLVGKSPGMIRFKGLCEKAMHADITVLIQGETGTGKELVANIIHENSSRCKNAFIVQNCAAVPENLFENELFGHKKGAFTGAANDKKGVFELADKGTVFLDEIGDLPLMMQGKLLRLLQEGELRVVGGNRTKHVDVRIISATNRDLAHDVKEGRFRQDLYYRLSVFKLSPPPLRAIKSDIPLLVRFFINKFNSKHKSCFHHISDDAIKALMNHSFPGNVRELENEIERAIVMGGNESSCIELHHLSKKISSFDDDHIGVHIQKDTLKEMVEKFEQTIIIHSLKIHSGNKTHTAKELGLSRVGLNNKIQRYKIV